MQEARIKEITDRANTFTLLSQDHKEELGYWKQRESLKTIGSLRVMTAAG
jgi:hypothetical protein